MPSKSYLGVCKRCAIGRAVDKDTEEAVDQEIAFQKAQQEHEHEGKTETVVWTEPDGKKTKLKFNVEGNLIDRSDLNG